jgi:hypothetical protein
LSAGLLATASASRTAYATTKWYAVEWLYQFDPTLTVCVIGKEVYAVA